MLNDLYDSKFLRRWSLNEEGREVCLEDAVDITLLSTEHRELIETKNYAIQVGIETALAVEAAQQLVEPTVPETIQVEDEEGTHEEPHPEWIAWEDAQALLANSTEEVLALVRVRAGQADDADRLLVDDVFNYPVEVTLRTPMPDLWPADFKAVLKLSGYYDPLVQWIDSIEDPVQQEFARSKLYYSAMYSRYDPMVLAAQDAIGITDLELDTLWLWASANY